MSTEMYYSGCNHWLNVDENKELTGTATAMHDCYGCDSVPYCKVKQMTEVFPMNAEIDRQMGLDINEMRKYEYQLRQQKDENN